ncbi:MAG: class I SAM-dependent methyltransferase [Bacteroidetes bacterium]|nr:class I SAM-dependent methyltransferase [Bacteroidota bacterium]MBS1608994.1 class I SAM-dependent methyltransferase [Bacteroidota bacterium]
MQLQEAIELIQHDRWKTTGKQTWADFGCGTGLFTYSLAHLLPEGSTIYSIDEDAGALRQIRSTDKVNIKTIQSDFTLQLPLSGLDGILMANSLHYIKDKTGFVHKAAGYMKPGNSFLIVEYDSDKPVKTWVPYPVSFQSLKKIFSDAGYSSIQKLNERRSVYNNGVIYSALVTT